MSIRAQPAAEEIDGVGSRIVAGGAVRIEIETVTGAWIDNQLGLSSQRFCPIDQRPAPGNRDDLVGIAV
jgi:hypothetical protein